MEVSIVDSASLNDIRYELQQHEDSLTSKDTDYSQFVSQLDGDYQTGKEKPTEMQRTRLSRPPITVHSATAATGCRDILCTIALATSPTSASFMSLNPGSGVPIQARA